MFSRTPTILYSRSNQGEGTARASIAQTLIQENSEYNDPDSFLIHDQLARDTTGVGYAGEY